MKTCPRCEKKTDLSEKNPDRPFCSEKCKLLDFGNWANEEKENNSFSNSFYKFFSLGLDHILSGYDHLLFCLLYTSPSPRDQA